MDSSTPERGANYARNQKKRDKKKAKEVPIDVIDAFLMEANSATKVEDTKEAISAQLNGRDDEKAISRAIASDGTEIASLAFAMRAGYAMIEDAKKRGRKTSFLAFYKGTAFPLIFYPDKNMLDNLIAQSALFADPDDTPHLFALLDSIEGGLIQYEISYGRGAVPNFKKNWEVMTGEDATKSQVSWYMTIIGLVKRGALTNDEMNGFSFSNH